MENLSLQSDGSVAGFRVAVHRSLTEPILLGGAPRSIAILNGTLAAALGLGLRFGSPASPSGSSRNSPLWIAGLAFWIVAQFASVWAAKRDPQFVEVVRRHLRYPAHLGA